MKQTLKLDPDNRTPHQIEIDRARIQGAHDVIKLIIDKIRNIENTMQACGYEISQEFTRLKNELGIMVYKDWHYE